jgi:TnpA family transposase
VICVFFTRILTALHEGLNVVENWDATNDFICYGRQGELATNGREPQEVVTLSLQLLQNCLMLINTILVERAFERDGLWERLKCRRSPCANPNHRSDLIR